MAEETGIAWCDSTFNPWIGCTKIGPGCDNCYAKAEFEDRRHRAVWGAGNPRSRTKTWSDPVRWNKHHAEFFAKNGRRQRVFCASLADVFDNEVPTSWRMDLFKLIADTPNLDWLILTKRIGNVSVMCRNDGLMFDQIENIWIGASIVNQQEADRDIPKLLEIPAKVRFLSMEPLLGAVDLDRVYLDLPHSRWIDWVIVGGESRANARPMSPDWARTLRNQCTGAGVPFFFKQWGEWIPMLGQANGVSVGKKTTTVDGWVMGFAGTKHSGRLLDGVLHNEFPRLRN